MMKWFTQYLYAAAAATTSEDEQEAKLICLTASIWTASGSSLALSSKANWIWYSSGSFNSSMAALVESIVTALSHPVTEDEDEDEDDKGLLVSETDTDFCDFDLMCSFFKRLFIIQ